MITSCCLLSSIIFISLRHAHIGRLISEYKYIIYSIYIFRYVSAIFKREIERETERSIARDHKNVTDQKCLYYLRNDFSDGASFWEVTAGVRVEENRYCTGDIFSFFQQYVYVSHRRIRAWIDYTPRHTLDITDTVFLRT